MTKKMKKAFTLVELVIVIAVVAILAAVLIPTFTSLIDKANESYDVALAKNMNTILSTSFGDEQPETMDEVYYLMEENGYIIENISPRADGNIFVWDERTNTMLYLDENATILYASSEYTTGATLATTDTQYMWMTVSTAAQFKEYTEYSMYLTDNVVLDEVITVYGSIDTASKALDGDLQYTGSKGTDYPQTFRGSISSLTVNAPSATVYNYATLDSVEVLAVATESYHEFGSVGTLTVNSTASYNIVIEQIGSVQTLEVSSFVTGSTITNNGIVEEVSATATSVEITNNAYIGMVATGSKDVTVGETTLKAEEFVSEDDDKPITEIGTYTELITFREKVNNGYSYAGQTVKITASIDISARFWRPIGANADTPFAGTITADADKNITINGLNVKDDDAISESYYITATAKSEGYAFGFIGWAYGDVTVENLTFTNVDIDLTTDGNMVGTVIGYAVNTAKISSYNPNYTATECNVTIDNVVTYGMLTTNEDAGGFIGKSYNDGMTTITNSVNNVNVISAGKKAGGFIGYVNNKPVLTFENCVNNGDVTAKGTATSDQSGGFVSYLDGAGEVTLKNCTNNGNITSLNCTACGFSIVKGDGKIFYIYGFTNTGTINGAVSSYACYSRTNAPYIWLYGTIQNSGVLIGTATGIFSTTSGIQTTAYVDDQTEYDYIVVDNTPSSTDSSES